MAFEKIVLNKRLEIEFGWCDRLIANPLKVETQPNGRIRHWGIIAEADNRVLRVVTLDDGETVHNAFFQNRPFKITEMMINPYVKKVKPLENYCLMLWFTNGEQKIFDLKPYFNQGVFRFPQDLPNLRLAKELKSLVLS